jgi:hypothetical protein
MIQVSVDSVVARLWVGQSGVRIQAGARVFSFVHNGQTGFGADPTSYSVGMDRNNFTFYPLFKIFFSGIL